MNAIKALLAVSVLAAAGAASAATVATYDIVGQSTSIAFDGLGGQNIVTASSGSGTAVLDDSGALTITAHIAITTFIGTDSTMDVIEAITGTWNGTTFTPTSSTQNFTGCENTPTAGADACSSLQIGVANPTTSVSGSATLAAGSFDVVVANLDAGATTTYHYDLAASAPAVPVPAAAWLFGSGLLGLAGTARRRRVA